MPTIDLDMGRGQHGTEVVFALLTLVQISELSKIISNEFTCVEVGEKINCCSDSRRHPSPPKQRLILKCFRQIQKSFIYSLHYLVPLPSALSFTLPQPGTKALAFRPAVLKSKLVA